MSAKGAQQFWTEGRRGLGAAVPDQEEAGRSKWWRRCAFYAAVWRRGHSPLSCSNRLRVQPKIRIGQESRDHLFNPIEVVERKRHRERAMSFELYINEHSFGQFANTRAWYKFCLWADKLPLEPYRHVIELAEHGYCGRTAGLRAQLQDALLNRPPSGPVAAVAQRLIAATKEPLETPEDENCLWITDGVDGMCEHMLSPDHPALRDPDADEPTEPQN